MDNTIATPSITQGETHSSVSQPTDSVYTGSTPVILPAAPAPSWSELVKSKKLIVISFYIAIMVLNRKLSLGILDSDLALLTGAVSAYLLGQSAIDVSKANSQS